MKLEIRDLCVSYGGIRALKGVSLSVDEGQIVTLIGANGAGKSTTLRAISGLQKVQSGSILYGGEDLTGLPAKEIVQRGIIHVPEGRRVFPDMTVAENLKIGAFLRTDKAAIAQDMDYVYSLFPRLKERSWQLAGTLSGGEQQMLAVGRALMSRPKVLMMDEPSLGLAPLIVKDIFSIIRRVNQRFAHRAERQRRPAHRQLWLCAGNRNDCPERYGRGTAQKRIRSRGVSGKEEISSSPSKNRTISINLCLLLVPSRLKPNAQHPWHPSKQTNSPGVSFALSRISSITKRMSNLSLKPNIKSAKIHFILKLTRIFPNIRFYCSGSVSSF